MMRITGADLGYAASAIALIVFGWRSIAFLTRISDDMRENTRTVKRLDRRHRRLEQRVTRLERGRDR
jgi:hypothetical protein